MGTVVLNGATSGSTTIQPTDAVTATLTLPSVTSTLNLQGPSFSAYLSGNQTLTSGVSTKMAFDSKNFDTNNCYNTSTYRFTPNVAGYYLVTALAGFSGISGAVTGPLTNQIYKNGGTPTFQIGRSYASSDYPASNASALIYLNGSTDYIECYMVQSATASGTIQGGSQFSAFSAFFVRGA
jgi:hypothetical protein